jgi:cation:H+ antiporter
MMIAAAPNIAVSDALGLMMPVVLDEANRDEPLYRRVDQGHILTTGFGVIGQEM